MAIVKGAFTSLIYAANKKEFEQHYCFHRRWGPWCGWLKQRRICQFCNLIETKWRWQRVDH